MTPEERQALERRISELLEPMPEWPSDAEGYTASIGIAWIGNFSQKGDDVFAVDWTTDEILNSRLLEMMPAGCVVRRDREDGGEWEANSNRMLNGIIGKDSDRKIAVCLAFIPWFSSLSAEERAEVLRCTAK